MTKEKIKKVYKIQECVYCTCSKICDCSKVDWERLRNLSRKSNFKNK